MTQTFSQMCLWSIYIYIYIIKEILYIFELFNITLRTLLHCRHGNIIEVADQ